MNPRIYLGVGYLWQNTSYGYPQQNGVGFGLEKLPDLDQPLSWYGSAYYYPTVKGSFTDATSGLGYTVGYRVLKYQPRYYVQRVQPGVPRPQRAG